jgi:hypothetical protein
MWILGRYLSKKKNVNTRKIKIRNKVSHSKIEVIHVEEKMWENHLKRLTMAMETR